MLGGVEVLIAEMNMGMRGMVIYRLQMFAETTEDQIRVDVTTGCCSIDSERDTTRRL